MTQREQIELLYSHRCACGGMKAKLNAFCRECYYALPAAKRRALYRRIPRFGEAYEDAVAFLKARGAVAA